MCCASCTNKRPPSHKPRATSHRTSDTYPTASSEQQAGKREERRGEGTKPTKRTNAHSNIGVRLWGTLRFLVIFGFFAPQCRSLCVLVRLFFCCCCALLLVARLSLSRVLARRLALALVPRSCSSTRALGGRVVGCSGRWHEHLVAVLRPFCGVPGRCSCASVGVLVIVFVVLLLVRAIRRRRSRCSCTS